MGVKVRVIEGTWEALRKLGMQLHLGSFPKLGRLLFWGVVCIAGDYM